MVHPKQHEAYHDATGRDQLSRSRRVLHALTPDELLVHNLLCSTLSTWLSLNACSLEKGYGFVQVGCVIKKCACTRPASTKKKRIESSTENVYPDFRAMAVFHVLFPGRIQTLRPWPDRLGMAASSLAFS